MTEVKKQREFKQPAMKKLGVKIEGTVKYSNLREPSKAPDADDKSLAYGLVLTLDPNDAKDMAAMKNLDKLVLEGVNAELESMTPSKRKTVPKRETLLEDDVDKDGNPTGLMMLRLKKNARRNTANGMIALPPPVITQGGEKKDLAFIRRGSKVEVTFDATSYNIGTAGTSIRMTSIDILEEAPMPVREPSEVDMGHVDEDADVLG